MRRAAVLIAATTLFASTPATAHGLWTEVGIGGTTRVTVRGDQGGPLAGAAWSARPPGADHAFASGVTDASGRFVFRPDRPGAWRVRVAGADGHGAVITVDVTAQALAGTAPFTAAAHLHGQGAEPEPASAHDHDHDQAATQDHGPDGQAAAALAHGHAHGPASPARALRVAGGAAVLIAVFAVIFVLVKRRAR
jgi:hypothetical protein